MSLTHDELCLKAEKFLKNNGFGVVFHDKYDSKESRPEVPPTGPPPAPKMRRG